MSDLVKLGKTNLHMNLSIPAIELVQNRTYTFYIPHMKLFKPAHKPVQTYIRTCPILHMNPFKPAP
jgi:hypothetical protein